MAALAAPAANCARFAAPAATTNRRNSGCNAAPWVHKNRPHNQVRNDSLIKLGLFEPYGACSTTTRKSKQGNRDNKRALAAHGGTYRASDNRALRRSCGDGLRASEKTAPTEEAAATPDSAETKAQTLATQVQANHTKSRFWKEFALRGVWRGLR